MYRLTEAKPSKTGAQNLDSRNPDVNHGIAQGMLVTLDNLYGYETFVPTHDQTVKDFQGQKLKELVTIKDCTDIFRGPNLSKVREIDVLWFNEDDYGLYPTYAFEVEHTTRGKNGLDRLLKIPRRFPVHLFIVGPGEEEQNLFELLIMQTPFRNFRERFVFRAYGELQNIYNAALNHEAARTVLGVRERFRET